MDKWSEGLPRDAFDQILSLCTLSDRVRMRSVCKSWLSVSNSSSRNRSTELPWLMMMVSNPNSKSAEEEGRCFFSLSEKRIYSIKTPETRGWRCCGSFNSGWLMTINRKLDIRLLHPWRKTQLQLPHYSTVYPIGFTRSYPRGFQNKAIHKAAMSDDEAVVSIIYEGGRLAFCRIREDKVWTRVLDVSVFYRDIIYNRGHFCVVCFHGEVGVVIISKSNPYVASVTRMDIVGVVRIPEFELARVDCIRHRTYLVADSSSGTIFTIKRIVRSYFDTETSSPHYIFTTLGFHVYEVGIEESTGEYKKNALEVESIGDRVMFLGLNSSMIVMASQFPDFKGNCIYFTDDFLAFLKLNKVRKGCTDMGVFNMEDKTIYPLFPERVHPPFSPPIWITPTL